MVQRLQIADPIHLIGVGGIGMSAIAKVLKRKGFRVQGSDIAENDMTAELESLGIKIFIGHASENIAGAGLVVVSTAIQANNPELIAAQNLGLMVLKRAEMLAKIVQGMRILSVTGTHGKTTTTGLLGMLCIQSGFDPLIINGGIIAQLGSNAVISSGRAPHLAVIEADESDGSFLMVPTDIGVVTNMDCEHLEYYGSQEKMIDAYKQFISATKEYCFICCDHAALRDVVKGLQATNIISYGIHSDADIIAKEIEYTSCGMKFNVYFSARFKAIADLDCDSMLKIELALYGNHNVTNALAVIGIGLLIGSTEFHIKNALESFGGIKRRFEKIGEVDSVLILDDYAHHPEELKATLSAAKVVATHRGGRLIAVMQPHRYTRLSSLMMEFAKSFDDADYVFIAPVYAAGEQPITGVNHEVLAEYTKISAKNVQVFDNNHGLSKLIHSIMQKNDVVILMGAGNITTWAHELPKQLEELFLH